MFIHGKNTVTIVDGNDISAYVKQSELVRTADSHDLTHGGDNAKVYGGGLTDATATISGTYDNTAGTGPRATFVGKEGTVVPLLRQIEGTGSGLPQDSVNVLITKYTETAPVADYVQWSADFQCSGPIDSTPQV